MNKEKWFRRFKKGKIEGKKTKLVAVKLKEGELCSKVCVFGEVCNLCNGYCDVCDRIIMEHFGAGDRHYLTLEKKMKFISYDGEYPNLCNGTLKFEYKGEILEASLYSTGCAYVNEDGEEVIEEDLWKISSCPLTSKKEIKMLEDLANAHVPMGCCGGCI